MTDKARVVLQDLKTAISLHTDALQSERFRISWIAIVTLLRAVGHVLAKVDSTQSEEMKRAVDEKWNEIRASRPEPKIFWFFIESERNRFLKNYEHTVSRSLKISSIENRSIIAADLGNSQGYSIESTEGKYISRISSGVFQGRSEKKLAWEAYDWWEEYLDDVDKRSHSFKNT